MSSASSTVHDFTNVTMEQLTQELENTAMDIANLVTRTILMPSESVNLEFLKTYFIAVKTEQRRRILHESNERRRLLEERLAREEMENAMAWYKKQVFRSQEAVRAFAAGSGPTPMDYVLDDYQKKFENNQISAIPYVTLYRRYAEEIPA